MFRPKQNIKSWINERIWINPYWHKISEHPGRIFLEQDVLENKDNFHTAVNVYLKLICEFGSGSGEHLIELAKINPNSAVIGFELRFKRIVKTVEKAKRFGVDNLFVVCGYAQNAVLILDSNSIEQVYINFPDPWEKKTSNRLLNLNFLENLRKILIKDAKVSFKTDHRDYYLCVKELVENQKDLKILFETEDLHSALPKEKIILTEFERLFLSQDLKINALEFTF